MCLYVLSSVLWCSLRFPHKNDVRFVFTSTCCLLFTLCVFTFLVPCCDVRYDFHIYTMFGSSLPPVVSRKVHVLITLFVLASALWCPTHIVLCVCGFFCVYPMLPVSLDCPFLPPLVFSNVYSNVWYMLLNVTSVILKNILQILKKKKTFWKKLKNREWIAVLNRVSDNEYIVAYILLINCQRQMCTIKPKIKKTTCDALVTEQCILFEL